jgi:lysophospholipase L1-like esterase
MGARRLLPTSLGRALVYVAVIAVVGAVVVLGPISIRPSVASDNRTGVYQFEHPNSLVVTPGATPLNLRRGFVVAQKPSRFRIHVRNRDFLHDADVTATLGSFTGYIGNAAAGPDGDFSGDFSADPIPIIASTSLVNGAELISPWIDPATFEIQKHQKYLLSFGFTVNAGDQISVGGGRQWVTFNDSDAGAVAPDGLRRVDSQGYLDIYLEYEFADSNSPILMVVGNSFSGGGNTSGLANRGELDSWEGQWALAHNGVAADLSAGGAWASNFAPSSPKWNYYSTLNRPIRPDAVVFMATAASDVTVADGSSSSIEWVKNNMIAAITKSQSLWPNAETILTTLNPRIESTAGAQEDARLTVNQWLSTLPAGADHFVDMEPYLTDGSTPARLNPEVDSGDHTHLSPHGYSVLAQLIPAIGRRR